MFSLKIFIFRFAEHVSFFFIPSEQSSGTEHAICQRIRHAMVSRLSGNAPVSKQVFNRNRKISLRQVQLRIGIYLINDGDKLLLGINSQKTFHFIKAPVEL